MEAAKQKRLEKLKERKDKASKQYIDAQLKEMGKNKPKGGRKKSGRKKSGKKKSGKK
jgi:hypothetical protein